MKDFTKKGTKLPVIPVGTKFRTVCYPEFDNRKIKTSHNQRVSMVSYGVYDKDYILCESDEYENHGGTNYFIIKLSTIERLAKEQGMCDDGITITFKQTEPFRVLELQPDLKVTFPCGHEITMQTNQFLTTNDCEQCKEKEALEIASKIIRNALQSLQSLLKSQQMNPTITLQENGDVIISNTETTTTLSKVTVDEICRLVKDGGEKVKLEVGKWYTATNDDGDENKCCFFVTKIYGNKIDAYGFNYKGVYRENSTYFGHVVGSVSYQPASPETVQQYLMDEFIRLGGKVGAKVECLVLKESVETITSMDFYFEQSENCLWVQSNTDCGNKGACIFDNGKFATIIQPETITRAEAEKQLGKVITD